jgi:hypothetical protein
VPGLPAESLEVSHRSRIGREHLKDLSGLHLLDRFSRLQDWQGAIEALGIENLIDRR